MKMRKFFSGFVAVAVLFGLAGPACPVHAETVYYSYDADGRLTNAVYGIGSSISYSFDLNGTLTQRTITAITDSDHDGMDDAWEMAHFGTLARNGSGDFDGDGQSDLAEYLAGTDPTTASSRLQVLGTVVQSDGSVTISWSSVSGRHYRLQSTDDLSSNNWVDVPGDVTANTSASVKTDFNASAQHRYYRILLVQ